MNWQQLTSIIRGNPISVRIGFRDGSLTEWSKWLTIPSDSYGEMETYGPFRLIEVMQVQLNSIEISKPGKLLPPREIDHSAMLEKELVNAGIIFSKKESIYTISIS